MKRLLAITALLASAMPAIGQVQNTRIIGRTASDNTGYDVPVLVTPDGKLMVSGIGGSSGSSASVGTNGNAAPSSSDQIGGQNATGNLTPLKLDTNGDLRLPTVTVTPWYVSLAANTSTTLLAASSSRIGFDIQCASGGVGISRTGVALTSATPSSGGADLVIPTSSTPPYFSPAYVSKSGVTGYTATSQACWGVSYAQQ